MATTTTVREAIHEKLDPVIEEIVAREISQRGGYAQPEQGRPFEALMPVLLSTLMQRRQVGQEPERILETILPALSVILPNLLRRQPGQVGQEPQRTLEAILPALPALLPALLQRRQPAAQPILQALLPALPALLPIITQQTGRQQQARSLQAILPVLLSSVVSGRQAGQAPGQEQPLQALAPVLVAALSAC
jgi:hypothetical protein